MLHDPLYDWSVGPSKAAAKQAGELEELKKQECDRGNRFEAYFLQIYFNFYRKIYIIFFF